MIISGKAISIFFFKFSILQYLLGQGLSLSKLIKLEKIAQPFIQAKNKFKKLFYIFVDFLLFKFSNFM